MNENEIKKAWNTFKKEIAKEIDIDLTGCCYMNKKQLENGTATITLCIDWSYEDEIAYYLREIDRFSSWDGENKERAERFIREKREAIANIETKKANHGTRENEVRGEFEQITSSSAFKKLAAAIAIQSVDLGLSRYSSSSNIYQIRISY